MKDVLKVMKYIIALLKISNLYRVRSHQVFNTLLTTLMGVALASKLV